MPIAVTLGVISMCFLIYYVLEALKEIKQLIKDIKEELKEGGVNE